MEPPLRQRDGWLPAVYGHPRWRDWSLQLCLERVRSRADHGFRDLEAARHIYKEFADAEVARRHVVNSTEDLPTLASGLFIF